MSKLKLVSGALLTVAIGIVLISYSDSSSAVTAEKPSSSLVDNVYAAEESNVTLDNQDDSKNGQPMINKHNDNKGDDVRTNDTKQGNDVLKKGDPINATDEPSNESNVKLNLIHAIANMISGNGTFDNGGKPLSKDEAKKDINTIIHYCNAIKTDNNSHSDKIKEIHDMATELYEDDVELGDERLQDLQKIVSDLDTSINGKHDMDKKVDEIGDPINPE